MAAPNRITCPLCQASIKAPHLPTGAACTCPKCGQQFRLGGDTPDGPTVASAATVPAPLRKPTPQSERTGESYPEQVAPEAEAPPPTEIPVTCTLCTSRYYAPAAMLGKETKCPDCHTRNVVVTPRPKSKKAAVVLTGDEYAFVEEPLPPRPAELAGSLPAVLTGAIVTPATPTPPPLPRGEGAVSKEMAVSMLAKAAQDLEDTRGTEPPDMADAAQPFFQGTISSLAQAPGVVLLVLLSVGLTFLVLDFRYVRQGFSGGLSLEHIFVIIAIAIGALGLAIFLAPLAATVQAIVQDTAIGQNRVDSWPGLGDSIGQSILPLAAAFVSAAPGLLLVTPGILAMPYPGLMVPGILITSLWALFPMVFLSMGEANSVLVVAAPSILRSLSRSGERWFLFYFVTVLLAFGAFFTIALMLESAAIMVAIGSVVLITSLFVYSRWLGRLAFYIAKDEEDAEAKAARTREFLNRVAS